MNAAVNPVRVLSMLEARVLCVLVEKSLTVADSYPLSLNALVMGCNQKTARDPVINATEAEVMAATDALKAQSLVIEVSGSRVTRFEHNMQRVLKLPSQSVAVLTALVLRGAQTTAELRANTERLHRFADLSSVEGFLDELAEREPPLVVKLPRAPGSREARWAQLLCGPVDVSEPAGQRSPASQEDYVAAGELAALRANQLRMEGEIAELRVLVGRLYEELGVSRGESA